MTIKVSVTARRVCTLGGWRRILRSPCQYYGRLLVVTAVLVQTTPRGISREVASISGQLHRLFTTLENEVKHYFSSSSMSPQVDPWNPLRAFSDSDTSVASASQQVRSSLGTDVTRLLVSTLTGFGSIAATGQQQPRERG